jgi:hypothetical protein
VLRVLDEVALGLVEALLLAIARLADGARRFVFSFHGRRATPV